MDIKVGEYVKFKDGEIRQVIGRDEDNHLLVDINIYDGNWLTFNEEANIVKHSFNLIDLLEVRRLCEFRKNISYSRRLH